MLVVSGYFWPCVNQRFSLVFRFQTRDACQMRITSVKLAQTGEIFWDNRGCFSAWESAFGARRMKVK